MFGPVFLLCHVGVQNDGRQHILDVWVNFGFANNSQHNLDDLTDEVQKLGIKPKKTTALNLLIFFYVCLCKSMMYVYVWPCLYMYVYVCLCMDMFVYVCLCMSMYVYVCL